MKSLTKISQRGFTLIEAMIVVSIIGILATVAVPRMGELVGKAKWAAAKGEMGAIRSAISIYYGDVEGYYPLTYYADGTAHFGSGVSLSTIMVPRYLNGMKALDVGDPMSTFNNLAISYYNNSVAKLAMSPPNDAILNSNGPEYLDLTVTPYGYDQDDGRIWVNNGNYQPDNVSYYYEF